MNAPKPKDRPTEYASIAIGATLALIGYFLAISPELEARLAQFMLIVGVPVVTGIKNRWFS